MQPRRPNTFESSKIAVEKLASTGLHRDEELMHRRAGRHNPPALLAACFPQRMLGCIGGKKQGEAAASEDPGLIAALGDQELERFVIAPPLPVKRPGAELTWFGTFRLHLFDQK